MRECRPKAGPCRTRGGVRRRRAGVGVTAAAGDPPHPDLSVRFSVSLFVMFCRFGTVLTQLRSYSVLWHMFFLTCIVQQCGAVCTTCFGDAASVGCQGASNTCPLLAALYTSRIANPHDNSL